MTTTPSVAVLIPCHNSAAWIEGTLESVRSQEGVSLEVVVVDDGSSDDSVAIVERTELKNLTVVRQAQAGASRARTVAMQSSRAPFLLYLDADDVLTPGTVAARLEALTAADADVAYTNWVPWKRQPDGSFAEEVAEARVLGACPEAEILVDAWWPPGALLYRRSFVEQHLHWREDLPVIQDARFLLDAAICHARFVHVNSTGLKYRIHGSTSLSRRNPRAFHDDCYRSISDVDVQWTREGLVDGERRQALVSCYAYLARIYFDLDRRHFHHITERLLEIDPQFVPKGPPDFRMLSRVLGYPRAEYVAAWLRPVKRVFGGRPDAGTVAAAK